jgi:hypothetical protein
MRRATAFYSLFNFRRQQRFQKTDVALLFFGRLLV